MREFIINCSSLKLSKVKDEKKSQYEVKSGHGLTFCYPLNLAGLLKTTEEIMKECSYPPEFEEKINKEINLLMILRVKDCLTNLLKGFREIEEIKNYHSLVKGLINTNNYVKGLSISIGRVYSFILNENENKLRPDFPCDRFIRIENNKQPEIYFTCMGIPGTIREFPTEMTDKIMFYPLYEHENYPKEFEVEFNELIPVSKIRLNKIWEEYLNKEEEN